MCEFNIIVLLSLIRLILSGNLLSVMAQLAVLFKHFSSICHYFPFIGRNFPIITRPSDTRNHHSSFDVTAKFPSINEENMNYDQLKMSSK